MVWSNLQVFSNNETLTTVTVRLTVWNLVNGNLDLKNNFETELNAL